MIPGIEISVVTSVYQGAAYIEDFYARMSAALTGVTRRYEIIFVNDGSTDNSLEILQALQSRDPRIIIIDLTRNFGQHPALWAGLSHSKGAQVFVIDCDLEEAPEHLGSFHATLQAGKADMVFAAQKSRRGSGLPRIAGNLFFWALGKCTDYPIISSVLMMRLMTREYVDAILRFQEHDPRMTIIAYKVGFKTICIPIDKRDKGSSSYSMAKRVDEACRYLTGISTKPLAYILYGGVILLFACFLIAIVLATQRVSLAIWVMWMLAAVTGVLLLAIGTLGIYLGSVLQEVRHQPIPMVRRVYEQ